MAQTWLTEEQRAGLIELGLDPDRMQAPRMTLPPLAQRIAKLRRYLRRDPKGRKARHYRQRLAELERLAEKTEG